MPTAAASRQARSSAADQQSDFNADTPRKRTRYQNVDADGDVTMETEADPQPSARRARPSSSRSQPATASRPRRAAASGSVPRFDSAAAAAAAAAATGQVDGYKPREERSWEEFHPELEIDDDLQTFTADEVDGIIRAPLQTEALTGDSAQASIPGNAALGITASNGPTALVEPAPITPPKRRPGRPPRRPESMLTGLGSPPGPRITPLPAQNPRERLNLPKPSFRRIETFKPFEDERENAVNYVDRGMANVGYQESEMFLRVDRGYVRLMQDSREEDRELGVALEADGEADSKGPTPAVTRVEYDMDEQDERWLEAHNAMRKEEDVEAIRPAIFEITMTQIEKEWHALEKRIPKPNPKPPQTQRPRSSSAAAVNGEAAGAGEEQDSKCAICDEGDCENANAIVFCDGCDLAVHQECYGIPFIPEGQWLCRKCQMVGRSTPACLFCPNTEGAFKMTHESRWAHLLCAIWIKEVSLGNTTFMEPIMDVANVPGSRWKLVCYICNQQMGASIQCQHSSCYRAYHVTCARKAKLYLQMKVPGGALALDSGSQVSYCDKHVPASWRKQHDVDRALIAAQSFYRRTMKGRRWASSQQSALAMLPSNINQGQEVAEEQVATEDGPNAAATRKKQLQAQKNIWRLPSGAPVVPQVVFDSVEMALARFALRRRKEYVAEACKYWSLKREARRGAALLKRLQLQMETFSASEIMRRDFSAMGAAGRSRLERRIKLADQLLSQLEAIQALCTNVHKREQLKLQDAEAMKEVLDTIYFPIGPMLEPIMQKAQQHDPKGVFAEGFAPVLANLEIRHYSSVAAFSADAVAALKSVPGLETATSLSDAQERMANAPARDDTLDAEQKELKKLAKRIMKAIQPLLYDALRKEVELSGRPFDKDMLLLDKPTEPMVNGDSGHLANHDVAKRLPNGGPPSPEDVDMDESTTAKTTPRSAKPSGGKKTQPDDKEQETVDRGTLPTPAPSEHGALAALAQGGVPWYLEAFDPVGVEVHDERWTGRDVLRGMSEELSEIDEDELNGLGPDMEADSPAPPDSGTAVVAEPEEDEAPTTAKKAPAKKKRSSRRLR